MYWGCACGSHRTISQFFASTKWVWSSNSVHQVWQQEPLPTELSYQLCLIFWNRVFELRLAWTFLCSWGWLHILLPSPLCDRITGMRPLILSKTQFGGSNRAHSVWVQSFPSIDWSLGLTLSYSLVLHASPCMHPLRSHLYGWLLKVPSYKWSHRMSVRTCLLSHTLMSRVESQPLAP